MKHWEVLLNTCMPEKDLMWALGLSFMPFLASPTLVMDNKEGFHHSTKGSKKQQTEA